MLARRSRDAVPQKAETAPFASKATDLQALRDAVVDAAGVGTGLWFSYLFVLFYFAIAAGAVTHRDLLLENPVKLPFLNVELPLKAFFILGPLVFLIVHAYVLLHFVLLAGKIGAFHSELEWQVKSDDTRAHLRRQLPSNIFVQSLAGPRDVRKGPIGFLLWLVIGISLIAGPIALLALFQLQFLPYHSEWITNWQRIAVVIDLVLLWILWPSVARGETRLLVSSDFKRVKVLAWLGASTLPVLLTVTIATFPGEWLEEFANGVACPDNMAGVDGAQHRGHRETRVGMGHAAPIAGCRGGQFGDRQPDKLVVERIGSSRFQSRRSGQVVCRRQDRDRVGYSVAARPRFERSGVCASRSRQGRFYRHPTRRGRFPRR